MLHWLKKVLFIVSIAFMIDSLQTAIADQITATQVGRYLSVANAPLASQTDLLTQTFKVRFPTSVKTVGDAMHYLLQFSSYSLANHTLITDAKTMMMLPLPRADRALGPLSLQEGLLTLAGEPFGLLVDPVHRLIAFRLIKPYQSLYQFHSFFKL